MPKTILLVDDEPGSLALYGVVLKRAGYLSLKAKDADSALKLLDEIDHAPDMIFLDTMMPGMHGIDLCKLLRDREDTATIPILIMGIGGAEEVIHALEAGANEHIHKFDLVRKLVEIIEKWINDSLN